MIIKVSILIFSVFLFSIILAKIISPPKTLAAIVCQEHYLGFNSGCYNDLCTSTSDQFRADCTEIDFICRMMGKFCDRYTGAECCQLTHGAATTCTSIDNSDLCYPGGPADGIRCCWDDGSPVPPPPTPTPIPFNCTDQGGIDYECFSGSCPVNWVSSVRNPNTTCAALGQTCCWFNPPGPTPTPAPPSVNAGPDRTITLPSSAFLDATVADSDSPLVVWEWRKQSGPGSVTFSNGTGVRSAPYDPTFADTNATFSQAGSYVIELAVSDGVATVFDTVNVTVSAGPPDLRVTGIGVSYPGPDLEVGETATFTITVDNAGGSISPPTSVSVYERATAPTCGDTVRLITTLPIGSLAPGASESQSFTGSFASPGTYTIWAFVDPGCTIPEPNETNNKFSTTVTVVPTSTPTPGPCPNIIGNVWVDLNDNVAREAPPEFGYSSPTRVDAYIADTPILAATDITDINGDYIFPNLCSPSYDILFNGGIAPAGYRMATGTSAARFWQIPGTAVNFFIVPISTPTPGGPPTPTPTPLPPGFCSRYSRGPPAEITPDTCTGSNGTFQDDCSFVIGCPAGVSCAQIRYFCGAGNCVRNESLCPVGQVCQISPITWTTECVVPPPTPTPAPPTPTPIPVCSGGNVPVTVTITGSIAPACVPAGGVCSLPSDCCPGSTGCVFDAYTGTNRCAGGVAPPPGSMAVSYNAIQLWACGGFSEGFSAVSQVNSIPIQHFTTQIPCCGCSEMHSKTTKFGVFNFTGLSIPLSTQILSATLNSPTTSFCEAGSVAGRIGTVSTSDYGAAEPSFPFFNPPPGPLFGQGEIVSIGTEISCGFPLDPDWVCNPGSNPPNNSKANITTFFQDMANTASLTNVALRLRPNFVDEFMPCTTPVYTTEASGNFSANDPSGPASLTITYCAAAPPTYSISGNVFVDDNRDTFKNGAEVNYSLGTSTIEVHTGDDPLCSAGTLATTLFPPNGTIDTSTGAYTTGAILPAGLYTLCYTTLPPAYDMTFPPIGVPPPNFNVVTVGPGCDASGANPAPPNPLAATCDAGNNIVNANFGIVQAANPWFQSVGSSMRIDAGFNDLIPGTALPLPHASLIGGGLTPGIIFSGNSTPSFGGGSASSTNWKVGNSPLAVFTPSIPNTIKTSYDYLLAVAQKNAIIPHDISTGGGNERCFGGIANCKLNPGFRNGLYIANGDLVFTGRHPHGDPYTFPSNRNYVILVDGDLIIKQQILVPNTSTVTFAVKGDIKVDGDVGELTSSSTIANIEGYYSADKNFIVRDDNINDTDEPTCPTADRRLNIAGTVITNASLTGGSLQNQRSLCSLNQNYPSLYIIERPDFILNAPQFLQSSQTIWQEVAP